MLKLDWHYLCLDTMMDYITLKLDSLENNIDNKDIFHHFEEAIQVFTKRLSNSLNGLTIDDKVVFENSIKMDLENMLRVMSRIINLQSYFLKQNIEYVENWFVEKGLQGAIEFPELPELPEINSFQNVTCQTQEHEIGEVSDENKLA